MCRPPTARNLCYARYEFSSDIRLFHKKNLNPSFYGIHIIVSVQRITMETNISYATKVERSQWNKKKEKGRRTDATVAALPLFDLKA